MSQLDEMFKFKIGDVVQLKVLGERIEKPVGLGFRTVTEKENKNSWISMHFSEPKYLYQVVERLLQECHGGIQKHYQLRMVRSDGAVERQFVHLTEDEVEISVPFRREKELTKEEVLEYVKDHFK